MDFDPARWSSAASQIHKLSERIYSSFAQFLSRLSTCKVLKNGAQVVNAKIDAKSDSNFLDTPAILSKFIENVFLPHLLKLSLWISSPVAQNFENMIFVEIEWFLVWNRKSLCLILNLCFYFLMLVYRRLIDLVLKGFACRNLIFWHNLLMVLKLVASLDLVASADIFTIETCQCPWCENYLQLGSIQGRACIM